ncbi:MAG: chemotaxis protein CheA [Planctomycetota bacterium]|nr:MAG: chemotaxis protein CheA [Planctomycetota bacterium]
MDEEFINAFVDEGRELIDEIEPSIIELKIAAEGRGSIDAEQINALFRLFHTLKGSAGFLGFGHVTGITHEAESLLDQVRMGARQLTVSLVDHLCQAIDHLRVLLDGIAHNGRDSYQEQVSGQLIDELAALLAEGRPEEEQPQSMMRIHDSALAAPKHGATAAPLAETESGFQEELRERFVQEGEELLDVFEGALLEASKDPQLMVQSLHDAFRQIHSFKGNCGIMGLGEMESLAHRSETALDVVRNGFTERPARVIEDLLSISDVLRGALRSYQVDGDGSVIGLDAFMDVLGEHLLPETAPSEDDTAAPVPDNYADPEPQEIVPAKVENDTPLELPVQIPARKPRTISEVQRITASFKKTDGKAPVLGAAAARQDVRVDLAKLDSLVNLVGELVLAQTMVASHPRVADCDDEVLQRSIHLLQRVAGDLQDIAMSVRMIPLSGTFRKMLRVVHDVAKRVGKQVRLEFIGEETEVDKTVIEKISDPLVHIVRNAVDHGLELPEERIARGKPSEGVVTLEARHESGEVWILIRDDGRGLDRGKILNKAIEKEVVGAEAHEWNDSQVFNLVFSPGFSTAAQVTDVSGRGVGMDVVKKNIERLKGRVDILSESGKGSTIRLRLPLTLAIIDGLVIRVGSGRYILPILNVKEAFQPQPGAITVGPDGSEMVRVREEIFPVIRLSEVLGRRADGNELIGGLLVLVDINGYWACLLVDELIGQQETVIKGLSQYLGEARGVAGCTILGDGSVALILDLPGILAMSESVP